MQLILFTASFPFGSGEQFLETELKYLAKEFDRIIIIPTYGQEHENCRVTPGNVEVKSPVLPGGPQRLLNFRFIPYVLNLSSLKIVARDFVKAVQKGQLKFFLTALNTAYYLSNEPSVKALLEKTTKNDLLYFYWGAGAAFMLPFMEAVKAKKVFRVHGSDLYEALYNGYFPFRSEQLAACDRVFPVSRNALECLTKKYPLAKEKGEVFRLGVDTHLFLSKKTESGSFHIVSCSSLIKLKRVSLIVNTLMQIKDIEILWTHFGDGVEREDLFEQMEALPLNIKVTFKGLVPNKEIYDFYKNESVDLFINLSSSEGIPVSIMEALSYGIPVIATDVGGTSELVNEKNGVLVDKNVGSVKVAQKVLSIIKGDLSFDRKVIKSEFKSNFDARKNYSEFSQYLVGLLSDESE